MGSTDNCKINAAYVASWKKKNPKLHEIVSDGHYLFFKNNSLYMLPWMQGKRNIYIWLLSCKLVQS